MQKIQILFPAPLMRRLRDAAAVEDRPISEVVRRATESWLDRRAAACDARGTLTVPTFHGGKVKTPAAALRALAWEERVPEKGASR
jgi:hypothetical protein